MLLPSQLTFHVPKLINAIDFLVLLLRFFFSKLFSFADHFTIYLLISRSTQFFTSDKRSSQFSNFTTWNLILSQCFKHFLLLRVIFIWHLVIYYFTQKTYLAQIITNILFKRLQIMYVSIWIKNLTSKC